MDRPFYITVILPLRLGWEPYYRCCDESVSRGTRVRVMFSGKEYIGVADNVGASLPEGINPSRVNEICGVEPLEAVSAEELELWSFVADYYMCTIGEVYKAAYPISRIADEKAKQRAMERAAVRKARLQEMIDNKRRALSERLEKKKEALGKAKPGTKKYAGLLDAVEKLEMQLAAPVPEEEKRIIRTFIPENRIKLSEAQEKAKHGIETALSAGKPVLLHGVTGSGKTEIYLTLAIETMKKGRNVLFMVPEIAVSRQIEQRIRSIFGETLLVSHSAETSIHRREVADAMRSRPYILLGTRSSVFLPHRNLGLIIIDEEHERSYKQDEPSPRYNGRDTAAKLAQIHGAGLVLGSATPSFESLYNCNTGRYNLVTLDRKYYDGHDADIEIIDTKAERRKRGMRGSFSIKLIEHIRKTLDRGEQVMILRARRSYAPAVQCESCGEIPHCPHCNVSMSLHHGHRDELVCHWCGHREVFTGVCPECGGRLVPLGAGTQKIEEEAMELFPDASVARLDADNSGQMKKIIEDFAEGRTDILTGTQIVAKGFDFERLTLVATILSDGLLGQQDFRADERALQLLVQLRGRCSRRGKKGLFVIQTATPEHPVYSMIDGGSAFADMQLAERYNFAFPPFTRLIVIVLKDTEAARLESTASALSRDLACAFGTAPSVCIDSRTGGSVRISYPYTPVIDKVSDKYIRHIRIVLKRDATLSGNKRKIAGLIADFEKKHRCAGNIYIDVDPS